MLAVPACTAKTLAAGLCTSGAPPGQAGERECATLSHLPAAAARPGCDTSACQTTACSDSTSGVLSAGGASTTTTASPSCAVVPVALPTTPRIAAPTSCAYSIAITRFI